MGKILVVAEKPSVARDYAKVLDCSRRKDGYIEGDKYIVTWAIGHLITLAEPKDYDEKLKKWSFNNLPILPTSMKLKEVSNTAKQFNIIKGLMNDKNIEHIICGTDSGREGELIFRYIYEHANCSKKVYRLWISSMTDKAIKDGFVKIKDSKEYDNLFYSAKCRSEADWLVGINATRSFTVKYDTLLSIGRVQTPTLALIVKRQEEFENFKPKEYYEFKAEYEGFEGIWFDEEESETKIFKFDKVERLKEKVEGQKGKVKSITKAEKKIAPPLLYDLTELQIDGNKKFGYSAQEVLSIVQNLYEKRKMVTYPRTDSKYLTNDMKEVVKQTLNKLRVEPYKKYIEKIKEVKFSNRIINDSKVTDHHAIIPTNVFPKINSLSEQEFNIYNLIVNRFIEVFYPYYIYKTTKVITEVIGETFISRGKILVQEGFTCISGDRKNNDQILPDLKKGQEVNVISTKYSKKQTKPPKQYTEASLLSAMEHAGRFVEDEEIKEKLKESGLGTPATRASIIERLIHVKYLVRKGKNLIPTQKAKQLISIVPEELKSPETTGKWEKGLTKISKGEMDSLKFMNSIKRYVVYITNYAKTNQCNIMFEDENAHNKRRPKNTLGTCPMCNEGDVLENKKAYYCTNWKKGCKFTIWKNSLEMYGYKIDNNFIMNLLKDKLIKKVEVILPQTKEKCLTTVFLNKKFNLEFKDLVRVHEEKK